jgi:16S rRNA (adenine1518-N6/adenine1519-N6)-dimethyltransferase
VIQQDILTYNLTELPKDYIVVANIPYYLTSKLVRILCESSNPPKTAALLVQKEVAERIAAKPGSMSMLSVSAQVYNQVSLDVIVPAEQFTPPPKVDSQVVVLHRRQTPLIPIEQQKEFFRIVKAGFSERRKKLRSSLSGGLQIEKSQADDILHRAGISESARAQELSIEDWHNLTTAFFSH